MMNVIPVDFLGAAFWAGEAIGFIEDNSRTCRSCGREIFYGEDDSFGLGEGDDYLCPSCRDGYDCYDEDDDSEWDR